VSVEPGQHSTNFALAHHLQPIDSETRARSFTVTTHNRTLDLIARSRAVCAAWVRALELLRARTALAPTGSIFSSYVEELWHRADADRAGSVDAAKALKLVRKLNVERGAQEVVGLFHLIDDEDAGALDRRAFERFVGELYGERDEIRDLIQKIRSEAPPAPHNRYRKLPRFTTKLPSVQLCFPT
jgi:hypothetical protein